MGHVPPGPVRVVGAGGHVQGRQHRGAPGEGVVLSPAGSARRRAYGAAAEERAATWYREHGYTVVERNFRTPRGEIDLIARRGDVLVFCEVKARAGDTFGTPFEAVTLLKQGRIRRAAADYLRLRSGRAEVRFDVVAVSPDGLEVLEDAF